VAPRALTLAAGAILLATCAAPRQAHAEESVPADGGRRTIGLSLTLTYATAYVFRGYNVFQDSSQMDQRGLIAPGISWSIFDTGLTLGYWGAFQLYGENRRALVDGALGHEQDLFVTYDFEIVEGALSGSAGLYWYFYPFADPDVTGVRFPSYLEPVASLTVSTVVDVSLEVAYMHQVGTPWWVVYVHPSVSRDFQLHPMLTLGLTFGFGYKAFSDPLTTTDNVWDVTLDVELAIAPLDWLTLTPAIHAGWTNFEARSFEDEYLVWGSLDVSAAL
jgi:hypothetical protein